MSLPALTAVTHRWESSVAGHLERSSHVHVTRRCADLAELLGCAAAGVGQVAAVSVELRGLDAAAVHQLEAAGLRVLGVHSPGDETGRRVLLRWGVRVVIDADAGADTVEEALGVLLTGPSPGGPGGKAPDGPPAAHGRAEEGGPGGPARPPVPPGGSPAEVPGPERGTGVTVVVWGPVGAPGRTTVAVHLAAELARTASCVVLVDADTYGASVAQTLAVLDEAPGLAAAARSADHGLLERATLAALAPEVQPRLRLLTGLPRADRWPELREQAVRDVLQVCAALADWTVVDVGACLEQDEELSFDTAAPRRNGAALAALAAADTVLVVGRADPIGLQRLVRGVQEVRPHTSGRVEVVVNRVRAGSVGRDPARRVRDSLHRFAGLDHVHLVPEDRDNLDAAMLQGRTLAEVRPGCPAHLAVVDLADELRGTPGQRRRGRPRRARR